ncbi:MAG: hypothetical protein QOK07_2353 [Gemmatimonadaceae bacterium]|nr:hypothetical protein [Gemmatimonadaceae bacterium]
MCVVFSVGNYRSSFPRNGRWTDFRSTAGQDDRHCTCKSCCSHQITRSVRSVVVQRGRKSGQPFTERQPICFCQGAYCGGGAENCHQGLGDQPRDGARRILFGPHYQRAINVQNPRNRCRRADIWFDVYAFGVRAVIVYGGSRSRGTRRIGGSNCCKKSLARIRPENNSCGDLRWQADISLSTSCATAGV